MLEEIVILLSLLLVHLLQLVSLVLCVLNLVLILTILVLQLVDLLVQGVYLTHTSFRLRASHLRRHEASSRRLALTLDQGVDPILEGGICTVPQENDFLLEQFDFLVLLSEQFLVFLAVFALGPHLVHTSLSLLDQQAPLRNLFVFLL